MRVSKTRSGYWKHQTEREGPHSIKRRACGRNDNGTPYKGIQTDATDNLLLILWVVKSYGHIDEKNNDRAGYGGHVAGYRVQCGERIDNKNDNIRVHGENSRNRDGKGNKNLEMYEKGERRGTIDRREMNENRMGVAERNSRERRVCIHYVVIG